VADNVWRVDRKNPNNDPSKPITKPFSRKEDENNHFADMDQQGFGEFVGKTLLDVCKDQKNIDPQVWLRFYESLKGHHLGRVSPGALPFRVWQIYEQMVNFVKEQRLADFVCAAGLLAHYVGDACQPLHVSRLHHGDPKPDDTQEVKDAKGAVHSVYETTMLDKFREKGPDNGPGLVAGINQELGGKKAKPDVVGGHSAAAAVIELMRQTVTTLPPEKIVHAFPLEGTPGAQATVLWNQFKHETITCIVLGCIRLASFWESAWKEGQGDHIDPNKLVKITPSKLQKLYQRETFLQSLPLDKYENVLNQD